MLSFKCLCTPNDCLATFNQETFLCGFPFHLDEEMFLILSLYKPEADTQESVNDCLATFNRETFLWGFPFDLDEENFF